MNVHYNFRGCYLKGNLTIFFNNWLDISLILLGILSLIFGIKLSNSLKKISKESAVQTNE